MCFPYTLDIQILYTIGYKMKLNISINGLTQKLFTLQLLL